MEVFLDNMIYDGQRFSAGAKNDTSLSKLNYKSDCTNLAETVSVNLWNEENMVEY